MGRFCFGLFRTFIILENLVFLILASFLIYVSWSAADPDFGMDTLNDNHPRIVHFYISAISMGFGIIVFTLSLVGLFGALRKSEFALALYAAVIFFIITVLSILVVVSLTMQSTGIVYKDQERNIVIQTVNMYNHTNANDFPTRALDQIQKQASCCGVNSPNDWKDFGNRKIPKSCCSNPIEANQPQLFKYCETSDYKIGCWRAMTDLFHANLSAVRTVFYVLIGFGLVCSLAAMSMLRTLRRSLEVV